MHNQIALGNVDSETGGMCYDSTTFFSLLFKERALPAKKTAKIQHHLDQAMDSFFPP
jgi:hypothetical protein